ncbi:hypothetical protein [Telmatospirillum sp.]|uniref:hypothetical protein n=1 Tax=Telmatospirillum sp. TaxID=2079197 RepID=UPI002841CFE8|nr:hypothetical protein [Telmatospirillum sp.]MDR3439047.1 hypothetical protein [Telmatospirillum sp.]
MKRTVFTALLIVASMGGQSASADEGNCRTYAAAAIRQYEIARHIPGCFRGELTRRWYPDYDAHLGWCRRVGFDAAHGEYVVREQAIEGCRRRAF